MPRAAVRSSAPVAPAAAATETEPTARSVLFSRILAAGRDALPIFILGLAVIGVPVLVFEPQGLPRLRSLERDVDQVEAENRALEREIARLRTQVRLLKDDIGTIEHVARTEYGLVRRSEIVFQLPKGASSTTP
jgi:cell division protein FtsB